MITPSQASQTLDIPPATLRRYSSRFSQFLTPKKTRARSYSLEDIEILRRIREMALSGLTFDQIEELIPVSENDENENALITLPEFTQALELARSKLSSLEAKSEDQDKKLQDQDKRLKAIEDYFSKPLIKRLFSKL